MFEPDIQVHDQPETESTSSPLSTSEPKRKYVRRNIFSSNNRPPPTPAIEHSQRFSATEATEALSKHRNLETSTLIPLPTTLISRDAIVAPIGSKVGKHSQHKYAEVYNYTNFPVRLNPHPSGALHIIDVEAFCQNANIPPELALSTFTDTLGHGESNERRHGWRPMGNIYNIYGPNVSGASARGVCAPGRGCQFLRDQDKSRLKSEEEMSDSDGRQRYAGAFKEAIETCISQSEIARTIVKYRAIMLDPCPFKDCVGGKPELIKPAGSSHAFVLCSLRETYEVESFRHRQTIVSEEVDLALLQRLLDGKGLTRAEEASLNWPQGCSTYLGSSSRVEYCPFIHIDATGRPVSGQIIPLDCDTVSFRYKSALHPFRFAVLRTGTCNHPFGSSTMSIAARVRVVETSERITQWGGQPTASRVAKTIASNHFGNVQQALGDSGVTLQNIQDVLANKQRIKNPEGLGWDGLMEAYKTEQLLPAKERYVHLAAVNSSIVSPSNGKQLHYAILFSHAMAEALHRDGAHLQMDTTFPFKRGQEEELKEFKIGAMGTSTGRFRIHLRVFMNVHTTEAFRQVFESIFHSIEEVT
ncbi:hypothetical protein JCM5350_002549, partial [Sporobolomyces pararoseus]